jgi:hypothetical protein
MAPPYRIIKDALNDGLVVPFLGSGASLATRKGAVPWTARARYIPTATELANHLAGRTSFPRGERRDLTKVAQYCDSVNGRGTLNRELRAIFNKHYSPRKIHRYLAGINRPLLIVTTNYDDLIERAFIDQGRPYDLVIHTTNINLGDQLLWWKHGEAAPRQISPNKLYIDLNQSTVIYKMHGAVDRLDGSRDQYVITEDDYIEFLARMTRNKAIPAIFAEPFQTRHFLFLGYSLNDWNLRVVLNRLDKDVRKKMIRSWSVQFRARQIEKRFWQGRGVEVFDLNIDQFVSSLSRA